MFEFMTGIKNIGPAYPVRPVVPTQKDREAGKRRKKKQEAEPEPEADHDDGDRKPTIDEHV